MKTTHYTASDKTAALLDALRLYDEFTTKYEAALAMQYTEGGAALTLKEEGPAINSVRALILDNITRSISSRLEENQTAEPYKI